MAILSAYDIAELKLNVVEDGRNKIPVTVFSFAGPRVGNLKFKERCEELGVKVLRVVNVQDVVPTVPGIITNEKFQFQRYIEETCIICAARITGRCIFTWLMATMGRV